MRTRVLVAVLLAAALLGTSVSGCAKKEADIKIGLNAELTGSIPVVGQSCKNAALMAVDEVNAAGGLDVGATSIRLPSS